MEATSAMTGCGRRRYTVESIYHEHYPLLAYLKSWGDDYLLIIMDGYVIGMVRRDRRSMWCKLKERALRWWSLRHPKAEIDSSDKEIAGSGDEDLVHA